MANAEINDLSNKVTPLSTDEVEIQATAGGASNKATLSNLSKGINLDNVSSGTTNKVYTATEQSKLAGIETGAEVNTVDSVNTKTGAVVLNPDDLDDTSTTNKFTTSGDISKLAGIEASADVTDATNVAAAGAVMDGDFSSNGLMKRTAAGTYTVATAPTGDVVGTSDSQILTNKTIDASSNTISSIGTTSLSDDAVTAAKLQYGTVRSRQGGTTGDNNWYSSGTSNTDTTAKAVFTQVGRIGTSAGADTTVTFPSAFTYTPIVVAITSSAGGANSFAIVTATTTTTFTCRCINDGGARVAENINWIAIGQ